jgi:hypothetical protein
MIRLALFIVAIVFSTTVLAQQGAMSWPQVRKHIEQEWKSTYPTEKILKMEPKGKIQYYSSETTRDVSTAWGWIWEERVIERQGAFARQVVHVTIERANKTQALFEVAALFERKGNAWQFRHTAVGKVTDLTAAKAGDLPSSAQAVAIFTEAWKKQRPDFAVEKVEVLKSEPKSYQERRWINYKLAITATGTDKGSRSMYQKKYRCTPEDYSSVLKFEGGSWVADEKMIRDVNESRDCSLAK